MIKPGVVLLCGTLVVAGCGGDSKPTDANKSSAAPSAPAARKAAASAEQTVGMVSAVGLAKSTVPVALKFGLRGVPKLGEPLAIDLAVVPQVTADSALIQVADSEGIDTSAVAAGAPVDNRLEAGNSYKRSITVTPTKSGVLLLALTVSLKHDEITESRGFSIPIIVADAATATPAAPAGPAAHP